MKGSRRPGHTRARVRQARGTLFFLPIHLTRHRAPARLSARAARCDHPSVRITAALGAWPGDRCRALPGPFPPLLPLQTTLKTNPPGSPPTALAADMSIVAAASALFQAVLWLLATGLQSARGGPTRSPPPCVASMLCAESCPCRSLATRVRTSLRRVLTEALAPGRLAAYARVVLTDECQARLRMAEGSDRLSRWMRLSCYEAQEDVSRLPSLGHQGLP